MKIKVLHLFQDLMNLYGDYGNVSILCKRLEEQGAEVQLDCRSIGDILFSDDYDFIYCGAGTEKKRDIALAALKKEKEALKSAIESGRFVLFTGNSWEILGRSIKSVDDEMLEGLGFFDYSTVETDTRITGDIIVESDFLSKPICGFVNKCGSVSGISTPLFKGIKLGPGNSESDKNEGFRYKNFMGTELIGPILVKNPQLLKMIMKELLGDEYRDIEHAAAEKAYDVTLNALLDRIKK